MTAKSNDDVKELSRSNIKNAPPTSLFQDILSLLIKIFIILTALVLIFTFLFGIFIVKDMTMKPAVQDGDIAIFYRLSGNYAVDDIVAVEYEKEKQLRRIIAVSGDTVDITEEGLFINGSFIVEKNTQEILLYEEGITFPVTVPANHIFVLADIRSGSADSRIYGTVPLDDVFGKVTTLVSSRNF